MKFHVDGTTPTKGEIFVFGSNMAGRHGAGAALVAREKFGMQAGAWAGRWGQAYAIPTKSDRMATLRLNVIKPYVTSFLMYAREHPELEFFVTRVGCGLAGYCDSTIAPLFDRPTENCSFAEAWRHFINPTPPPEEDCT